MKRIFFLLLIFLSLAAAARPLPLTLAHFGVRTAPGGAQVQWQTADETNTLYFVVERSLDGVKFAPVAWVPAAGFSSELRDYRFQDDLRLLDADRIFYQLRFVDRDSLYRFSRVEVLQMEGGSAQEPVIYPNPTTGPVQFLVPQGWGSGPLRVTVTDGLGRMVLSETRTLPAPAPLNLSRISSGSYRIELQSGAQKKIFPLVKL